MVEFMQQGTTIASEVYCKTLKKLHKAIQNKTFGMLTCGVLVVLLHDNAHLRTVACTSLTHAYRNLFPNMTSASIPEVTYLLTHGAEPFLRSRQLCSYSRTSQRFMEPAGSLTCSQEPSPGPYPEPD
jgi:hypothetical protein